VATVYESTHLIVSIHRSFSAVCGYAKSRASRENVVRKLVNDLLVALSHCTCSHVVYLHPFVSGTVSLTLPRSDDSSIVSVEVRVVIVLVCFMVMTFSRSNLLLTSLFGFYVDIYVIDEQLTQTLRTYLMTLFSVISTLVVISGVTPV